MQQEYLKDWEKCISFHGHACGGLAVGFRAVQYARELLMTDSSEDEEIVCITENDACGVDAIQALLSCTAGKGNLIFRLTGKNAFSFYHRNTGKSVRLVLRSTPGKTKEERLQWLMDGDYHEMFDVKETKLEVPERARIFKTMTCACCGERFADSYAHLQNDQILCPDCYVPYTRGL